MTTANRITIFRILLLPVFAGLLLSFREDGEMWQRWAALGVFLLASILDGVDGFVARRFNQRSELGAILDPLADKLLLVSALVLLALNTRHLDPLPLWFYLTILSRDVLLTLGLGLVYFTVGQVKVRPRWTGKVATVLQMMVIVWTLMPVLPEPGRFPLALAASVLTAWSGIQYVWDGIHQLSASPSSRASPTQSSHRDPGSAP